MNKTTTLKQRRKKSAVPGRSALKVLTIQEIERRFKDEWILVADPIEAEDLAILGGRVAWHSKDRDEVYQKAIELKLGNTATVYTGPSPEHIAVNL